MTAPAWFMFIFFIFELNEINLCMEILGVMWMKNKLLNREIWEHEIIVRVNVQNFHLWANHGGWPGVYLRAFRTEEVSRNNATSRNI